MLWLCQIVFLDEIYKFIKINTLRMTAHQLSDKIDEETLTAEAERLGQRTDICIIILQMLSSDEAREIVSVDVLSSCALHNTDKSSKFTLYDAALENGGSLMQRYRFDVNRKVFISVQDDLYDKISDAQESMIYSVITQDHTGNTYLILLNAIITPLSATVRTLNLLLGAISVLLVITAALLAFLIARSLSRPITRLNESAKKLAMRQYDTVFTGGGCREVCELSDTLNYAASELSKVDDLCRELIANISHDLRTPLTMIAGYSEVMRDIPGENTPENVQIIIDETNRLTLLVNDMLDISRLQSGTIALKKERFPLTHSISDALTRYTKLIGREDYTIRFEADCDVWVDSDETRFLQVLYNLVNNALTYTGPDKTVTVRQTVSNGRVRISVIDTGAGIPPDQLPLIWDRYYRVKDMHRRAVMGTGLGLSIVKTAMEALGGGYGVTSTLGAGSTFWVDLPLPAEQEIAKGNTQ